MSIQFVTLVAVGREAASAELLALRVRGYKLRNSRNSIGARWYVVDKADQQVA